MTLLYTPGVWCTWDHSPPHNTDQVSQVSHSTHILISITFDDTIKISLVILNDYKHLGVNWLCYMYTYMNTGISTYTGCCCLLHFDRECFVTQGVGGEHTRVKGVVFIPPLSCPSSLSYHHIRPTSGMKRHSTEKNIYYNKVIEMAVLTVYMCVSLILTDRTKIYIFTMYRIIYCNIYNICDNISLALYR